MSVFDVELLIDEAVSSSVVSLPSNFERLWATSARASLAEGVRWELEAWDGTAEGRTHRHGTDVELSTLRLMAQLPGSFRHRLILVPIVPSGRDEDFAEVEVLDELDQVLGMLTLSAVGPGWLGPSDPRRFDGTSAVRATLKFRDVRNGRVTQRRARRVVLLRHDPLVNGLVEVDQVQLGDEIAVLVDSSVLGPLEKLLEQRPGQDGRWRPLSTAFLSRGLSCEACRF